MTFDPSAGLIVKTTVEAQRLEIRRMLTARQVDIPKMVDDSIDSVLNDKQLAESIASSIEQQVRNTIQEEIRNALRRAFWSEEMRARIANLVADAMKEDA